MWLKKLPESMFKVHFNSKKKADKPKFVSLLKRIKIILLPQNVLSLQPNLSH